MRIMIKKGWNLLIYMILVTALFSTFSIFSKNVNDPYLEAIKMGHKKPVVTDVSITDIRQVNDGVLFDIRFYKPCSRDYCNYVDVFAKTADRGLTIIPTKISTTGEDVTRSCAWNYGYDWKIPDIVDLSGVILDSQHRCHPDFPTFTRMYPDYTRFDFSSLKKAD